MPVADIINKTSTRNTISTVKTIQGLGNQQKAFQIQAMMRDQEFNNTLFNSLASINDNLSTVLKIKVENESKFISAGIEFFGTHLEKMDEVIKNTKGDDRTEAEIRDDNRAKDKEEQPDIFLSEGGLNIEEYIKNIKYNLKNIDELSFLFDTAETVAGDDLLMKNMIASPVSTVLKSASKALIPKLAKNSIKMIDDSVGAFTGALMGRINKMEDETLNENRTEILVELDKKFHNLLSGISKNYLIESLFITTSNLFEKFIEDARYKIISYDASKGSANLLNQHKRICEAIIKKDEHMASEAMREHMEYVIKNTL